MLLKIVIALHLSSFILHLKLAWLQDDIKQYKKQLQILVGWLNSLLIIEYLLTFLEMKYFIFCTIINQSYNFEKTKKRIIE